MTGRAPLNDKRTFARTAAASLVAATAARLIVGFPPIPIIVVIAATSTFLAHASTPSAGTNLLGPSPIAANPEMSSHDWVHDLQQPQPPQTSPVSPSSQREVPVPQPMKLPAPPTRARQIVLDMYANDDGSRLVICPNCGRSTTEAPLGTGPIHRTCATCGHGWRPNPAHRVRVDPTPSRPNITVDLPGVV